MFDGFFPQTLHDFLYNKRLMGFLLLIPGTRESKLLQTIGSHVADQLHSPLRPICSPRLSRGNPFQLFLYLTFKTWPKKVDRWLENFSSMTSNFLNNTCTKMQKKAFKACKMDQNQDAAHARKRATVPLTARVISNIDTPTKCFCCFLFLT